MGDKAVGCATCDYWFHPVAICLGLPESSIAKIVRLEGEDILFVCLKCRIRGRKPLNSRNSDDGTLKQLSEMVLAVCISR